MCLGIQILILTNNLLVPAILWALGTVLWFVLIYAFFAAITVRENKPTLARESAESIAQHSRFHARRLDPGNDGGFAVPWRRKRGPLLQPLHVSPRLHALHPDYHVDSLSLSILQPHRVGVHAGLLDRHGR